MNFLPIVCLNRGCQFLLVAMFVCAVIPQTASPAPMPGGGGGGGSGGSAPFTNTGSIVNTRHNLQVNAAGGVIAHNGGYNNRYGEVCVYCHTPHSANRTLVAPLWNRTIKITNYQTYDELGTTSLTQAVTSTPGPSSLTCLSCHDGQTAIDSVINMPGSGKGLLSQETTQNTAFLNMWTGTPIVHMGINSNDGVLGNGTGSDGVGCLTCHSPEGLQAIGSGTVGNDMRLFNIGTDLRNDHPVGITFPAPPGSPMPDWNTPAGMKGASNFFDENSNGRMEKGEIRTYDGKVECASCHDPHGVPSAGAGTVFNKTFLRKQNTNGSAVCLTCHNK